MKTREAKLADAQWPMRGVLECGSPRPLFQQRRNSARGLAQSKTWWTCVAALALLVSTLIYLPSTCSAQYAINWHTMDGGGGTSTGGEFQVNHTVNQLNAK